MAVVLGGMCIAVSMCCFAMALPGAAADSHQKLSPWRASTPDAGRWWRTGGAVLVIIGGGLAFDSLGWWRVLIIAAIATLGVLLPLRIRNARV